MTCSIIGFPRMGSSGLGVFSVSGLSLVPRPPATIIAVCIFSTIFGVDARIIFCIEISLSFMVDNPLYNH